MDFAGIAAAVSRTACVAAAKVLGFGVVDSRPCHLSGSILELTMTVLIADAPLTALLAVRMLLMQKVLSYGVPLSCWMLLMTKTPQGVPWFAVHNSFLNVALYHSPPPSSVPELVLMPAASIVLDVKQLLQGRSLPLPQSHLK